MYHNRAPEEGKVIGFDPAKYINALNNDVKINEMGVGRSGFTFPGMIVMIKKTGDLYLYGDVVLQTNNSNGAKVKVWRTSKLEGGFSIDMSALKFRDYRMICKVDNLEDAEDYFNCYASNFIKIKNMRNQLTPIKRPSPPQPDGQAMSGS
ncbi:MAG: hypothetical protein KGH59_01385 [Candidatus Micrarchaeota archaeon]|nr:hypothetical protein [Candidatus Micrarchaeota archaeon]MDE1804419.1 hypothetical protein [Candidatus Micrarchaeota archaeon]MDE1846914.1 hypothetical protein [Candidatus Micrarchaeota archaeon]